jgi:hypothetical protein
LEYLSSQNLALLSELASLVVLNVWDLPRIASLKIELFGDCCLKNNLTRL